MGSLQGFCQALLGESGVSPIHPKTSNCHPCALQMPKNSPLSVGALDADVPGEVSCGVSAAMDDVPFTNLTGTCLVWGLILPHPSVAIQSGS